MEVALIEAHGIPDGCVFSIQSGNTRRQAIAETDKPCIFSFPGRNSIASPLKVDLLAPLGSTSVEVSPATEMYPCKVQSRYGGKQMCLNLRVRQGSEPIVVQGSDDNVVIPSQVALDTNEYLDQHNLLSWMQGLIEDLIRDCPGNPWDYIDESTARARLQREDLPTRRLPEPHTQARVTYTNAAETMLPAYAGAATGAVGNPAGDGVQRQRQSLQSPAPRLSVSSTARTENHATFSTSSERIPNPLFDKMDLNRDGKIDSEEWRLAIEKGIIKRPPGFTIGSSKKSDAKAEEDPDDAKTKRMAAVLQGIVQAAEATVNVEDVDPACPAGLAKLAAAVADAIPQSVVDDIARTADAEAAQAAQAEEQRREWAKNKLFDKIDFKKDGRIDNEEWSLAIKKGIVKRPPVGLTPAAAKKSKEIELEAAASPNMHPRAPSLTSAASLPALALQDRPQTTPTSASLESSVPCLPPLTSECQTSANQRARMRLTRLRQADAAASNLRSQHDQLRKELGKLISIDRGRYRNF